MRHCLLLSIVLCTSSCATSAAISPDASAEKAPADAASALDASPSNLADAMPGAADATPSEFDAVPADAGSQGASLVITEIMANPVNVGDSGAEYIELLNTSSQSINLQGMTLAYVQWLTAGSEPLASTETHTFSTSTIVASGAYVVVAVGTELITAPDTTYSNVLMSNSESSDFRLRLYSADWDNQEPSLPEHLVDELAVAGGVSGNDNRGLSWQLDPAQAPSPSPSSNDDPANFCLSQTNAAIEIATGNYGTPGAANDCS